MDQVIFFGAIDDTDTWVVAYIDDLLIIASEKVSKYLKVLKEGVRS